MLRFNVVPPTLAACLRPESHRFLAPDPVAPLSPYQKPLQEPGLSARTENSPRRCSSTNLLKWSFTLTSAGASVLSMRHASAQGFPVVNPSPLTGAMSTRCGVGLRGEALDPALVTREPTVRAAVDGGVVGNSVFARGKSRAPPPFVVSPIIVASRITPSTNSRNVMAFRGS